MFGTFVDCLKQPLITVLPPTNLGLQEGHQKIEREALMRLRCRGRSRGCVENVAWLVTIQGHARELQGMHKLQAQALHWEQAPMAGEQAPEAGEGEQAPVVGEQALEAGEGEQAPVAEELYRYISSTFCFFWSNCVVW